MYGQGNISYNDNNAGGNGGAFVSLTTVGTSGAATLVAGVLNIPNYGAAAIVSASNGLSFAANNAVLGQNVGAVGNPAALLSNRQIPFAGFSIAHVQPKFTYNTFDGTPIHTYNLINGYLLQATMNNTVTTIPWEHYFDNNAAGGPPNDLISIQGWNVDSRTVVGSPSWTTRMEYAFQGHFYEYHIQWQNNSGAARTYRNMSFTMVDNGSTATDTCLVFFQSTDFEVRTLGGSAYTTATNAAATDFTSFTVSNAAGTQGLSIVADTVNGVVAIRPSPVAAVPLYLQTWSSVYFTGSNTGPYANGPGNVLGFNNFFDVATGGNFTWDTAGNQMAFFYAPHWGNPNVARFYEIFSNNTGEWTQSFRSTGGYFWQVQTHLDSGAVHSTPLLIAGTGAINFGLYGAGTFAGVATKRLSVDAGGNIIETALFPGFDDVLSVNQALLSSHVTSFAGFKWTINGTIADYMLNINNTGVFPGGGIHADAVNGNGVYGSSTNFQGGYFTSAANNALLAQAQDSTHTAIQAVSNGGLALDAALFTASTVGVRPVASFGAHSTGVTATSFGGFINFSLTNSTPVDVNASQFEWFWANATAGSETAELAWYFIAGGVEKLTVQVVPNGVTNLPSFGLNSANVINAANNAAAIVAGVPAGCFYRNGDVAMIVH